MRRQIKSIVAGKILRVISGEQFELLYTTDGWLTQKTVHAQNLGTAGAAADIRAIAGGASEIVFTFFWTAEKRWQGRNFSVKIEAAPFPDLQTGETQA